MDARLATVKPLADAAPKDERAFLEQLGLRVRMFREQAALTRRRLAAIADVSERYLGQLEAGEGNVSIVLLKRIADALGTEISELLSSEHEALAERLIHRFLRQVPAYQIEDLLVRLAREIGPKANGRRDRIALIGTRGAGKSTLGERYAREIDVPFIELDREIEREAGLPLAELFSLYGQTGFRRFERTCLERVLGEHAHSVIAVGGGIVNEPDSYHLLLSRCFTVWLKASAEEHMERVIRQGDFRPMAQSPEAMVELERLLESRAAECEKADVTVDTTGLPVDTVLAQLRQHLSKI